MHSRVSCDPLKHSFYVDSESKRIRAASVLFSFLFVLSVVTSLYTHVMFIRLHTVMVLNYAVVLTCASVVRTANAPYTPHSMYILHHSHDSCEGSDVATAASTTTARAVSYRSIHDNDTTGNSMHHHDTDTEDDGCGDNRDSDQAMKSRACQAEQGNTKSNVSRYPYCFGLTRFCILARLAGTVFIIFGSLTTLAEITHTWSHGDTPHVPWMGAVALLHVILVLIFPKEALGVDCVDEYGSVAIAAGAFFSSHTRPHERTLLQEATKQPHVGYMPTSPTRDVYTAVATKHAFRTDSDVISNTGTPTGGARARRTPALDVCGCCTQPSCAQPTKPAHPQHKCLSWPSLSRSLTCLPFLLHQRMLARLGIASALSHVLFAPCISLIICGMMTYCDMLYPQRATLMLHIMDTVCTLVVALHCSAQEMRRGVRMCNLLLNRDMCSYNDSESAVQPARKNVLCVDHVMRDAEQVEGVQGVVDALWWVGAPRQVIVLMRVKVESNAICAITAYRVRQIVERVASLACVECTAAGNTAHDTVGDAVHENGACQCVKHCDA